MVALRVTFCNVEHVADVDPVATKLARVGIVPNLQHMPLNVFSMVSEKILDIVAVDWPAAIVAEHGS